MCCSGWDLKENMDGTAWHSVYHIRNVMIPEIENKVRCGQAGSTYTCDINLVETACAGQFAVWHVITALCCVSNKPTLSTVTRCMRAPCFTQYNAEMAKPPSLRSNAILGNLYQVTTQCGRCLFSCARTTYYHSNRSRSSTDLLPKFPAATGM